MSMTITDVQKELNTYLAHNPDLISTSINRAESTLDKHTRAISKVKGNFPQGNTLITDVIQGFSTAWNEIGSLQVNHKILKNYHQKVNFPIIPAEILPSYWGHLYAEGMELADMPISKYIIEKELMPKVIDNMAYLEVKGVYNAGALGTFGNSMNGIEKILADLLALNPAVQTDRSAFKIPLTALTDTNIVDQVTAFERSIPEKIKSKITKIFMSENNLERYQLRYEEQFGTNLMVQNDTLKTRLGKREIVGIPVMTTDDIFATPNDNFARLIDVFDGKPEITDIQKQDYKLKLFMEFWKGYDFLIDEMVLISNYTDTEHGLGLTAKNQALYGIDGVTLP